MLLSPSLQLPVRDTLVGSSRRSRLTTVQASPPNTRAWFNV
ncbi:MAG: hypothetical protein K0S92_965 [Desertimonas sp.]|nr:hypothetical protein [Desertimonas sp.]